MNSRPASRPADSVVDLISRDYHLGLLAQVTEYAHRARTAEGRLEAEMTRAYRAEVALDEARKKLAHLAALQTRIDDIHNSTTWKIGRAVLLPVRILRRLLRK